MDSLTHTVLGACIGEMIAGKRMGKKAMFWGALANNLPDIDVVTSGWMNMADSLLAHRGFTHSIAFAVMATPLLSSLVHKFNKNPLITLRDWLWIFGTGLFFHIFIDSLTAYGTGWFEPFSHQRVSFNVFFILDPLYMIFPLLAFILLLILNKNHQRRTAWARFGIVMSFLYMFFSLANKLKIDADLKPTLEKQNLHSTSWFTSPTPLNNLLWNVIVPADSGFYIGYRSVFDREPDTRFEYFDQQLDLLPLVKNPHDLNQLIRFSQGLFTLEKMNDTLYLSDIRFGQSGGWYLPQAPFVFRYALNQTGDDQMLIQRGRMKSMEKNAMNALWKRMWGN